MKESENIEFKITWRDEYLKTIAAFANTQGGKLFLGVTDDGKIVGVSKPEKLLEDVPNKISNHLRIIAGVLLHDKDGKTLLEIVVSKNQQPVAFNGRYYVRSGSTTQEVTGSALQEFILKASNYTWDEVTMPMVRWDDFDLPTVNRFVQSAIQNKHIPHDIDINNYQKIFENLKLVRNKEFTRAAILLFAKEPTRFISVANCKIGRFRGNDPSDLISDNLIEKNLFSMPDSILELLYTKYLPSQYAYKGIQRIQKFSIPEKALREAVLNAIIHRDYSGFASTMIRVYDKKLSIWNQGSLMNPLNIEMLKVEHPSILRNRLIANVFYFAGYIEAWGRGTLSIINHLLLEGLPEPEFNSKGGGFEIAFYYEPLSEPLSSRQLSIIGLIKNNNFISINDLAQSCKVGRETIKRELKKLKEINLIKRVGSDKAGHWEIINKRK